jgi:signal transduction histidine kinase
MRRLHQLGLRYLAEPRIDAIAQNLFEAVLEVPAVDAITLRLRDEGTGDLEPVACHNLDLDRWRTAAPQGLLGLSKLVVDRRQVVTLFDLDRYASVRNAAFLRRRGLNSYAGIPLLADDEVRGVIGCYSKRGRGFAELDLDFLTLVADLTALAVYRGRSSAQPENHAIFDGPAGGSERAKAEFLNVMSHEFRTPLSLIMGHVGMVRDGLLGEINAAQRRSLVRAMENSNNLLAMVLSILQATTIEAGGVRAVARDIPLHQLFEELQAVYRDHDNDQRKIVWYCSPDQQLLRSDPERLKEILCRLLDNAVKFTARGRIVVSAEKVEKSSAIRFVVSDTGVGIPRDALPIIFEKFRQCDSSGTRAFSGAGLGLYIAKRYAQVLGGELNVTSEVGRGSTFTLTLPSSL